MTFLENGDRVRVNWPGYLLDGKLGTVVDSERFTAPSITVLLDEDINEEGEESVLRYFWVYHLEKLSVLELLVDEV